MESFGFTWMQKDIPLWIIIVLGICQNHQTKLLQLQRHNIFVLRPLNIDSVWVPQFTVQALFCLHSHFMHNMNLAVLLTYASPLPFTLYLRPYPTVDTTQRLDASTGTPPPQNYCPIISIRTSILDQINPGRLTAFIAQKHTNGSQICSPISNDITRSH